MSQSKVGRESLAPWTHVQVVPVASVAEASDALSRAAKVLAEPFQQWVLQRQDTHAPVVHGPSEVADLDRGDLRSRFDGGPSGTRI